MGTHGRKGLEKVFLGSVAENILRHAPCPVLTVNPHVGLTAEDAIAMKHILLATSFSPACEVAAAYAVSLAQENQAHLDIMHVIEPQKTGEWVCSSELAEGCARRLRAVVPTEAELWCKPNMLVEVGNPAEQILNVAKAHRAELIVMGVKAAAVAPAATHSPWATAHRIISAAQCPVLTVRG
jgi:nucleotide-binding universal stress UspA family protein